MRGTYAALLATPPNAPLIGWGWPIKTSSSSSMSSVRNSSSIYNDKMNKPSCKQLLSCRRKRGYIWISNPYDFHKERGHIKKKKRTFCIWNDSDLMPIIPSDTQRKKFEAGEKSKTAQNLFLTWRFLVSLHCLGVLKILNIGLQKLRRVSCHVLVAAYLYLIKWPVALLWRQAKSIWWGWWKVILVFFRGWRWEI